MDKIAKSIKYKGRVQGVGFRFTAHKIASRYDVTGFVKNLPDGSVELLAQGSGDDVDRCIEDIQESFGGYIRDTIVNKVPVSDRYHQFEIAY